MPLFYCYHLDPTRILVEPARSFATSTNTTRKAPINIEGPVYSRSYDSRALWFSAALLNGAGVGCLVGLSHGRSMKAFRLESESPAWHAMLLIRSYQ